MSYAITKESYKFDIPKTDEDVYIGYRDIDRIGDAFIDRMNKETREKMLEASKKVNISVEAINFMQRRKNKKHLLIK